MKIIAKILPLYEDLLKQGFIDFLQENEFARLCNDLLITEIYAEAYNKSEAKPEKDFLGLSVFNWESFLARLLNGLYEHRENIFCPVMVSFLTSFLASTSRIVTIDHILLDLKSLSIDKNDLCLLEASYKKYDENIHLKISTLKGHLIGRAANGAYDPEEYIFLRKSLIQKHAIKKVLPEYVIKYQNLNDFWTFIKPTEGYAARRQFINDSFVKAFDFLEQSEDIIASSVVIDNSYVNEVWQKALERVNSDAEAAITTARTLIETVCKHVLDETNTEYVDGVDLPVLYKSTAKVLKLSPDQHTEGIFKQILNGCQSVVVGLGSIRNKISDAHGMSKSRMKPSKRHGVLAVNLSGAMSQFLLQSFETQIKKNAL